MNTLALSAGLGIGLAGSLHCVAMCGPLAMAVPVRGNRWINILLYNSARISMYALLGLLFGSLGARIGFLEGGQRLSIILGVVVLLVFVLPYLLPALFPTDRINGAIVKGYGRIVGPIMRNNQGALSPLLFGVANGLLPCGLIYVALSGAVASGSGVNGAIFMTTIGLGTFPAMFVMMALRRFFKKWMQRGSRITLTVMAGMLGLVLIARGMNLDISYVSPKVEKVVTASFDEGCQ